jgi:hypothetical protein
MKECEYCKRPASNDQQVCIGCGAPLPILQLPMPVVDQATMDAIQATYPYQWFAKLIPWRLNA